MVTNKKFTLPHQNNSTLNFQKNSPLRYPPPQKKSKSLKNQHPSPEIKLPNFITLLKFWLEATRIVIKYQLCKNKQLYKNKQLCVQL